MPKFVPIPFRVASHLLYIFYNLLITFTFVNLTLFIFCFPLPHQSMPDESPVTPRVSRNDAQRTSPLLQCHKRAPEPDRHTNAASNQYREMGTASHLRTAFVPLPLSPFIYMSIYINRFNYPSLSLRNYDSILLY